MKKYINKFCLSLCGLFLSLGLFGQQIADLRINELLIKNDSNLVDEYGRHVPWVEIFNTAYNSVNIGGCFLTDDTTGLAAGKGNPNWYRIPKGDKHTLLVERSHIIFYLDNNPLFGTFHVNFNPLYSKSNYIALIGANAKTLIDIFEYPDSLRYISASYGCIEDGVKLVKNEAGEIVSNVDFLRYFTPGSMNKVLEGATKEEQLKQKDKYGIGLAVISMSVVFFALILIYLMLKLFARWAAFTEKRKLIRKESKNSTVEPILEEETVIEAITGEEIASICLAVHLYLNSFHDEESEIITIEPPQIRYSPWSQKHLVMKGIRRKK